MATPPNGLRAHDGAGVPLTQRAQGTEPRAKGLGHRVVRIVVKATVMPVRVDLIRDVAASAATAPYARDVFVSNPKEA